MKFHPAFKVAKKIAKQKGFDVVQCGTLSFHVCTREYNARPLIVDLILSAQEDKGKFDVCHLSEDHSMYQSARASLHGLEFKF
jgi:Ni,Fe-hydrogenase maturation factor